MSFKLNDYTDISYLGTTGATSKNILAVGSTAGEVKNYNILVYDITVSNQTGTGGSVRIYNDVATGAVGEDVYIYCSALQTVNVNKTVPFKWGFIGSTGVKKNVKVSAFAGAGVRTYIGAILQ